MKKILILTLAIGAIAAFGTIIPFAQAGEMEDTMAKSYCPMMASQHAQELGLSKKQEAQLQKIKDEMWAQVKPFALKASADTEAVLTAKQKAKYKDLSASQACENRGGRTD